MRHQVSIFQARRSEALFLAMRSARYDDQYQEANTSAQFPNKTPLHSSSSQIIITITIIINLIQPPLPFIKAALFVQH